MLDTVAKIYLDHGKWPAWAWLEETLERQNLDAWSIVVGMPTVSTYNYGYLRPLGAARPAAQNQVGIRIAGLRHVRLASGLVAEFCSLVGALGTIRSSIELDPFANERPVAAKGDVAELLKPTALPARPLLDFLAQEPGTWHCYVRDEGDADWTIELSPTIRRFAGIRGIDEYIERLSSLLDTEVPAIRPSFPVSPFSLPASIDFLDTAWRLRFAEPLVVSPGIERSARLSPTT